MLKAETRTMVICSILLTFLTPHPTPQPNAHYDNSDLLKTVNSSPDPSGFHVNLAEANRDNFIISDSRSPSHTSSPTYVDTEDMFNISDSPLRHPSPAPSGLDLNLADANHGIFAISDSRSPSPIPIDSEDMFVISSDSPPRYPSPTLSELHLNLAVATQDIFAIPDSQAPSPIYFDTKSFLIPSRHLTLLLPLNVIHI